MKASLFCSPDLLEGLKKILQKEGFEVEELKDPQEISKTSSEVVVAQFPLGKFTRGDVFTNLEELWDRSSPLTLIIKPPEERIRRRDLKANVVVVDEGAEAEEAGKKLLDLFRKPEFLLSRGLSAYAERNYPLAYEYWLKLARSERGRETKVFEYLKIARKEFEEAGLDITPIEELLMERVDPFREGTKLYSEGNLREALELLKKIPQNHPEFVRARALIETIKEELDLEDAEEILDEIESQGITEGDVFQRVEADPPTDLTPKEAFLLSLIDGEATVEAISKIVPMEGEEFETAMKKLLSLGLIRRKE